MQAFEQRRSTREFADRKLAPQDLSDLMWAANGMNRPDESKHTSPTARNRQQIMLYVVMAEGAYFYDSKAHELHLVTTDDLRSYVAGPQAFAATAPVSIVIVADMEKAGGNDERARIWSGMDAGIVSQSISLFCSGCGFATVPRALMDHENLHKGLKLGEHHIIYLNHPVGYFK